MIYAVIDTNVFVSAFITNNKKAATSLIFQHLLAGDITPLYNEEILAEYKEVLSRNKFHLSDATVEDFIATIKEYGIHEDRTPFAESMPDEDDRVFLEITLSREESFLVTGNLRHYPKLPEVVTPAEFISRFFGA